MDFADFIAPVAVERFMADHYGRQPLHISAPERGHAAIGWARLNELLAVRSHWSEPNINLVMNSRPVAREHYMDDAGIAGGATRLADAAKVDAFLAMGASFVGNAIEEVAPEARALTDMLARQFGGRPGANLYCSFQGVQAFASHYDNHEVFAVHCEGEKLWRIYRNRADAPLDPILGNEEAQQQIDAAKGPVLMEALMRPGDLLYIPRGFFHDALASSGESLHLTLAVAPHSGRVLFRLLERAALAEAEFREYLPDAREEGDALSAHVDALASRLGDIMRSPAFLTAIANAQRELVKPGHAPQLPRRAPLEAYARTDRPGSVVRRDGGAVLQTGSGELALDPLAEEAEWMLARPAFVVPELLARYPHRTPDELRQLIALVARAGLFVSYQPRI